MANRAAIHRSRQVAAAPLFKPPAVRLDGLFDSFQADNWLPAVSGSLTLSVFLKRELHHAEGGGPAPVVNLGGGAHVLWVDNLEVGWMTVVGKSIGLEGGLEITSNQWFWLGACVSLPTGQGSIWLNNTDLTKRPAQHGQLDKGPALSLEVSSPIQIDLSMLYIIPRYIDLSKEVNRLFFRSHVYRAVEMGEAGEFPAGYVPTGFWPHGDLLHNRGNGGQLVEHGRPTMVPGPNG